MNSQENEYLESRSQGNFRGARPRDDFQSILLNAVTDSRDMTNGIGMLLYSSVPKSTPLKMLPMAPFIEFKYRFQMKIPSFCG